MSVETKMLASRLKVDRTMVARSLESHLRTLAHEVERARKALADGGSMDEHLIVNAGSLSALIARWNMLLDYTPYVEEKPQ